MWYSGSYLLDQMKAGAGQYMSGKIITSAELNAQMADRLRDVRETETTKWDPYPERTAKLLAYNQKMRWLHGLQGTVKAQEIKELAALFPIFGVTKESIASWAQELLLPEYEDDTYADAPGPCNILSDVLVYLT